MLTKCQPKQEIKLQSVYCGTVYMAVGVVRHSLYVGVVRHSLYGSQCTAAQSI